MSSAHTRTLASRDYDPDGTCRCRSGNDSPGRCADRPSRTSPMTAAGCARIDPTAHTFHGSSCTPTIKMLSSEGRRSESLCATAGPANVLICRASAWASADGFRVGWRNRAGGAGIDPAGGSLPPPVRRLPSLALQATSAPTLAQRRGTGRMDNPPRRQRWHAALQRQAIPPVPAF